MIWEPLRLACVGSLISKNPETVCTYPPLVDDTRCDGHRHLHLNYIVDRFLRQPVASPLPCHSGVTHTAVSVLLVLK